MSGAIPPVLLYALIAWTGKIHLSFTCFFSIISVLAANPLQLKTVVIRLGHDLGLHLTCRMRLCKKVEEIL